MFGLMGKILRVNLTDRSIFEEEIPEETAKKYLGGRGLASKYLFEISFDQHMGPVQFRRSVGSGSQTVGFRWNYI